MTTRTYDFYIDSSISKNNNEISITLPHPIIINETSTTFISIKDFSMLNGIYNISNDLLNNKIILTTTLQNYIKNKSGADALLFDSTLIFHTANPNIYHPLDGTISWDGTAHYEIVATSAFNIYYYLDTLTTTNTNVSASQSYLKNIFDPAITNTTNLMRMNSTGQIIFKKNTSISNGDFVKKVIIQKKYTKVNNPTYTPVPATDTFRVYGSHDGLTWVESTSYTGDNTMVWSSANIASSTPIYKTCDIYVDWVDDYIYYKVVVSSTQETNANYTNFEYSQMYIYKYSTTNIVATTQEQVVSTLTIPDGVYSITTFNNYFNNLMTTLGYQNLNVSYIDYNYKWSISNNEVGYIYTAINKVDLQFNLNFVFNKKLSAMLGGNGDLLNLNLTRSSSFITPSTINLTPYKKLLITSNLKLINTPITILNGTDKSEGVGDILLWVDKDVAPFEYINYTNPTDHKLEIANKNINNITIRILNEFKQHLVVPSYLIGFNISIIDK